MESSKMLRTIGKVSLDYKHYPGRDYYSDGEIEDAMLMACKNGSQEELLRTSTDWPVLYHLSDIRENVIEWYPIGKNETVLEIGAGCGGITGILSEKAEHVTCVDLSEKRSLINAYRYKNRDNIDIKLGNFQAIESELGEYDYVTLIGVLEYAKLYINDSANPFYEMLRLVKKHLKPEGRLIIAIENKMGLKYFNGAGEDHTGHAYSGINDYCCNENVRTFSKQEMGNLLKMAGYEYYHFYYPTPDYKLPDKVYSDELLPQPGEIRTYKKVYSSPRIYNFMEDVVSDQICADGMYDYMANSFVVVTGDDKNENVKLAVYNRERKEQFRIATYVMQNKNSRYVVKKALTKAAQEHIENMERNEILFDGVLHGVNVVHGEIVDGEYITPCVDGRSLEEIMYDYRNDSDAFVRKVKEYIDKYFRATAKETILFQRTDQFIEVFGGVYIPYPCCSLRITNIDMIFSNIKLNDSGNAFVYDPEWVFDFPVPHRYCIWRAVNDIYAKYCAYLRNSISKQKYFEQFGLGSDEIRTYNQMERAFSEYVYGKNRKEIYTSGYTKSVAVSVVNFC